MSDIQAAHVTDAIPLGRIEAELHRTLASLGEAEAPVRRARMSNLVIYCDSAARAQEVQEIIPGIVAAHPARVLLAVLEKSDKEEPVSGSINTWCALAGGKQHVCSEQVTLRARGRNPDSLIYAIRSLLIGDLPANLWWSPLMPPPSGGPFLGELAQSVQQIVYDSNGWLEPAKGVAAVASWIDLGERASAGGWRVVSDVNWRRLKFWRRLMAQALDPNSALNALDTVTEVQLEHGPHAVIQAWLLVSWLASRLGWTVGAGRVQPGVAIDWQVTAPHGRIVIRIVRLPEGPSEIRRVQIRCTLGAKPATLNFLADNPARLSMVPEGVSAVPRTLNVQPQPLEDLIARQLSDRERDPVFRETMNVAQTFAKSVLKT